MPVAPNRGANTNAASRAKQPLPSPSTGEFVTRLTPVLEPYGWSEADIQQLVIRCNYNDRQIEEAVSHVVEEREGHEHGQWSNIATVSEKKEKGEAAKARKAQREKERAEEEEREKQRRQQIIEAEKKRHLEKEARKQALLSQKKQPGSALVRSTGGGTTTNAWRAAEQDNEAGKDDHGQVPENQAAAPMEEESQDAGVDMQDYKDDYSQQGKTDPVQSESWGYSSYDTSAHGSGSGWQTTEQGKPMSQDMPAATDTQSSDMLPAASAGSGDMYHMMSAPPGVAPIVEQGASWSGWETSGTAVAQGSSQTAAWTSSWAAESAAWDPGAEQSSNTAVNGDPVNGKAAWSSASALPTVKPIITDTVVMPPSFWELMGNRPVPHVYFGSLYAQSTSTPLPSTETGVEGAEPHEEELAGEEQAHDEARKPRHERSAPYGERDGRRGGSRSGKGGRRGKGEATYVPKTESSEGAAEDGKGDSKGRLPRKGSGRSGGGAERSGKGGKQWRENRQKGSGKSPSQ